MKTTPMIFSGPMVRALLEDRKTQTRRVIKDAPSEGTWYSERRGDGWNWVAKFGKPTIPIVLRFSPGDLLWVRESFREVVSGELDSNGNGDLRYGIGYKADGAVRWSERTTRIWGANGPSGPLHLREQMPWKPSIHMPRIASRLTLEVTAVKVERLQDLSEDDATAEGIERLKSGRGYYDPRFDHGAVHLGYFNRASEAFAALWDSINGKGAWDANPWVCALTFKVHKCNVDQIAKKAA